MPLDPEGKDCVISVPISDHLRHMVPGSKEVPCVECGVGCCVSPEAETNFPDGFQVLCGECAVKLMPDLRPKIMPSTRARLEEFDLGPFMDDVEGKTVTEVTEKLRPKPMWPFGEN